VKVENVNAKNGNYFMLFMLFWAIFLQLSLGVAFMLFEFRLSLVIILGQLATFFLPFILYMLVKKQPIKEVLSFRKISFLNIVFIIAMLIFLHPAILVVSSIISLFLPNIMTETILEITAYPFLIGFFLIAIVPSIFEEIAFRGVIFHEYKNTSIHKSALMNGLFFGIIHLNFHQFVYTFILGVLITYLVYYTRSIWSAFIAHLYFNGIAITFAYLLLFLENFLEQNETYFVPIGFEEEMSLASIFPLAVLAAIFFPIFILIFRKFKSYNNNNIQFVDTEEKIFTLPVFLIIGVFLIIATFVFLQTGLY